MYPSALTIAGELKTVDSTQNIYLKVIGQRKGARRSNMPTRWHNLECRQKFLSKIYRGM
jgi:hypothetical protein